MPSCRFLDGAGLPSNDFNTFNRRDGNSSASAQLFSPQHEFSSKLIWSIPSSWMVKYYVRLSRSNKSLLNASFPPAGLWQCVLAIYRRGILFRSRSKRSKLYYERLLSMFCCQWTRTNNASVSPFWLRD